jgi:hypothetical protein
MLLCIATTAACQKQRRPSRYLIPEGYVGWVKIYFKVKDAPVLPIEDGYYLFKFPESGILRTSSTMEDGWARDQYFSYLGETRHSLESTGWGGGGMIWAGYSGQGGSAPAGGVSSSKDIPEENKSFFEGFFIGTEAEYKDYGRYVDEEPGPLDKHAIERKKKRDGIR